MVVRRKKKIVTRGRKPVYTDLPSNLVSTYKEVMTQDGTAVADVLRDLNAQLGTNYLHSHLSRMERGIRTPHPVLVNAMLEKVLPVLLVDAGLSPQKSKAILKKILLNTGKS